MFTILLAFAEFERLIIVERTKSALAHKISTLQRVGEVRFGYDLAEDGHTLTPNECELETIEIMKRLRADGRSYQAIADHLSARGIPTKKGNAKWSARSVRRILLRDR